MNRYKLWSIKKLYQELTQKKGFNKNLKGRDK